MKPSELIDELKELRLLVSDYKRIMGKIATNKGFRLPRNDHEEQLLWESCRGLLNRKVTQAEHRTTEPIKRDYFADCDCIDGHDSWCREGGF